MNATALKTVLYVEDNPVNVHLVKSILALRGDVQFLSAARGDIGLALAHQHRPALILLDLHLLDMAGDEFLRRLQASDTGDIPVVILSGDSLDEAWDCLAGLAVAGYLAKPIDIDEFEKMIDQLLT